MIINHITYLNDIFNIDSTKASRATTQLISFHPSVTASINILKLVT